MSNEFIEARWPSTIDYDSTGGMRFQSTAVVLGSGQESVNVDWETGLYEFTCHFSGREDDFIDDLHNFFLMVRGGGYRFRFKHKRDYSATSQYLGTGDGTTATFQLQKNYKYISFNGSTDYNLTYAIAGVSTGNQTFSISGEHVSRFAAGHCFEVDGSTGNDKFYTTDSVTYTGGNTVITTEEPIADATVDGNIIPYYTKTIYKPVHGSVPPGTSNTVAIDIDGVTESSSNWSVNATTGLITFSGGNIPSAGEIVTADFEFDIPVRLLEDQEQIVMRGPSVDGWSSIKIKEVRL